MVNKRLHVPPSTKPSQNKQEACWTTSCQFNLASLPSHCSIVHGSRKHHRGPTEDGNLALHPVSSDRNSSSTLEEYGLNSPTDERVHHIPQIHLSSAAATYQAEQPLSPPQHHSSLLHCLWCAHSSAPSASPMSHLYSTAHHCQSMSKMDSFFN